MVELSSQIASLKQNSSWHHGNAWPREYDLYFNELTLRLCFCLKHFLVNSSCSLNHCCKKSIAFCQNFEELLVLLFQAQACLTHCIVLPVAFKLRCYQGFSFLSPLNAQWINWTTGMTDPFVSVLAFDGHNSVMLGKSMLVVDMDKWTELASRQSITFQCVNMERVKWNYSSILFLSACVLKLLMCQTLQNIKM